MTQLNDVLKVKWKTAERKNSTLEKELEAAQRKVSQLKTQHTILSNKKTLLKEYGEKASKVLESLKKELAEYKAEKTDLAGKLKMAIAELLTTKGSLERVNKGTMKLTEILGSQRNDHKKTGIGDEH